MQSIHTKGKVTSYKDTELVTCGSLHSNQQKPEIVTLFHGYLWKVYKLQEFVRTTEHPPWQSHAQCWEGFTPAPKCLEARFRSPDRWLHTTHKARAQNRSDSVNLTPFGCNALYLEQHITNVVDEHGGGSQICIFYHPGMSGSRLHLSEPFISMKPRLGTQAWHNSLTCPTPMHMAGSLYSTEDF